MEGFQVLGDVHEELSFLLFNGLIKLCLEVVWQIYEIGAKVQVPYISKKSCWRPELFFDIGKFLFFQRESKVHRGFLQVEKAKAQLLQVEKAKAQLFGLDTGLIEGSEFQAIEPVSIPLSEVLRV